MGPEDRSRRDGADPWRDDRPDAEDPVARFFARERADVRPEHAGDLHWQRIVRESRRPNRWRWTGYLAGVAAAAVVGAVAGAAIVTGGRFTTPDVTAATSGPSHSVQRATGAPSASATTTPPPSPSPDGTSTGGQSAAPPPTTLGDQPVPGSFTATSLSNSGGGFLYAMGSSDCGDRRCATLVGSDDDGATWHTVHVFGAAPAADPSGQPGRVPAPGTLSQVRFANPGIGWVYGGGLKITRDGGQTWHDYAHPGQTVVDLETDGYTVTLATAGQCGGDGLCRGPLQLSRAPITATGIDQPTAREGGAGGVLAGAKVQAQRGRVFLEPDWAVPPGPGASARRATGAARLVDGTLAPLSHPAGCTGSPFSALAPSADPVGQPTVFALCGGPSRWQVQRSSDDGRSWRQTGQLALPAGDGVTLAASDARHLVAATAVRSAQGADRAATLTVSSDGGATWHEPAQSPGSAGGWAWVGAPGGGQFYALSGSDGSYWRSLDDGEHWEELSFLTATSGSS